ncbi:MAG: DUF3488 domain-containing protein [Phycisphaerae bacterium]|nr:DUF3488 domain-containing protein [Phycisphaerae bacterium]
MYDIRQFKPALYALIVLGITGFGLAVESFTVWALAMTALIINVWLVRILVFRPIPHWLANVITVLTLLVLIVPLRADATHAVLVIGEFLVVLQVVKIYELRANRDYAQLLILSLLLMVAASINTASLVFGILLVGYLFLSLYCCLLFHLKVETDHAKAAIGLHEIEPNPATLRQDQRYLSKSMRRLTTAIAIVGILMAIAVFILFPRGAGAGLLSPMQAKEADPLTGFSDTVSFQRIAQISQNNAQIAWVKVFENNRVVPGVHSLLLRGVALNIYTGDDPAFGGSRHWERGPDEMQREVDFGRDLRIAPQTPRWRQEVTLEPTGTPYLFAMPGVCKMTSISNSGIIHYWPRDEVLESTDTIPQQINYVLESNGHVTKQSADDDDHSLGMSLPDDQWYKRPRHSYIDPAIEAFARRPEVSGSDATGALAARRSKTGTVDPLDPVIAQHICDYLQQNFTYTLDLTDAKSIGDRDPLVAFLYDFKRGHCEYFAGSMALMCQSLGMKARVVVGFKCDEYNTMLQQYVVRQSHAHAWVEVLDPKGEWETFDPTTARGADTIAQTNGLWRRAVQLAEYLQYTWATSVVAYDQESRANLINNVDRSVTNSAINSHSMLRRMRQWLEDHADMFASRASVVLFIVMLLAFVSAVTAFAVERWRIRRRARRIGVEQLPASDQLRLLRQLGFYESLVTLLERHRIARPKHLTPLEFSRSINFLPRDAFDAIGRLTHIFYDVRYGRYELSVGNQRHLNAAIAKIDQALKR